MVKIVQVVHTLMQKFCIQSYFMHAHTCKS